MINIENISKTFNPRSRNKNQVLKNISFDLPDKGLVAIFGKSGSGKTTLMNIIGGLDKQDSGKIIIDGINTKGKEDKIRNEKIGYIFQNYNLEKGYTISEILHNQMLIAGFKDEKEISKRTTEALTLVEMERFKNKRADALSGGQQQRIAIARALVKGSDVILADEPTGNLDAENTIKVMEILKEISRTQLVVLVTHEVSLITRYADSHIKIVDGVLVKDGEIDDGEFASATYDSVKDTKKEVNNFVPHFDKSISKSNGRLFTAKSIFKLKRHSEEKAYGIGNIIKQIFILAMAVIMCFFAFSIFEILNKRIDGKVIDKHSLYLNMNAYSDLRKLDTSLYDDIDFFESQYKIGSFSYNNISALSGINEQYVPKPIEQNDTVKKFSHLYGKMPLKNEILITRNLAEKMKKNFKLSELNSDQTLLMVIFEQKYRVSGIADGDEPTVYMNKEDYVNFLNVYNSVSLADYYNLFLSKDYKDATFTSEIRLAKDGMNIKDNEVCVEINRNSLYKMMPDVTQADFLVEKANTAMLSTGMTSTSIQIKGSKPMYVQRFIITRDIMAKDIIIYVNRTAMDNIFVYLQPNLDALKDNVINNGTESEFFFKVTAKNDMQLKNLKTRLAERGISTANITELYQKENSEIISKSIRNLYVYIMIIALLYIIYFFIEKSASIKNSKEYGIYRAIGVNKKNLLYKETLSSFTGNIIPYLITVIIVTTVMSVRYAIIGVGFGGFIAVSTITLISTVALMTGLSLIPYLFVLTQTPAQILSKYDI